MDSISSYTAGDALADGLYTRGGICKGLPVYVTCGAAALLEPGDVAQLVADFLAWDEATRPTLPEEDWLYTATFHGETVWVDETPGQITILLPEEY